MAAIVGIVPDEELGVVVLENRDHAECRHALLWKVLDLWGGKSDGRDWSADLKPIYDEIVQQAEAQRQEVQASRVPDTSPSLSLESYAGTYTHELYDQVSVTHEGDVLRLVIGPGLAADLGHWHHDTFEARFDDRWRGEALATFSLDDAGQPARLDLFGLTFDRLPESPTEE